MKVIKGDIRDKNKLEKECKNHDVFINLACISNDTSFQLDEKSLQVHLGLEPMVLAAKRLGLRDLSMLLQVCIWSFLIKMMEDHPLVPLTLYNKYKGMCEPVTLNHTDNTWRE